jgi:hypothetical protein
MSMCTTRDDTSNPTYDSTRDSTRRSLENKFQMLRERTREYKTNNLHNFQFVATRLRHNDTNYDTRAARNSRKSQTGNKYWKASLNGNQNWRFVANTHD